MKSGFQPFDCPKDEGGFYIISLGEKFYLPPTLYNVRQADDVEREVLDRIFWANEPDVKEATRGTTEPSPMPNL